MDTATAALSFHSQLQEQAAKFYEKLAHRFVDNKEKFLSFAKEHRKHQKDVQRAYNYIITDAMEACFAFEGMNEDDYKIFTELKENITFTDAMKLATTIEDKTYNFCVDGAERSKGMLHDVPEALEIVAKRTLRRKQALQSLLRKKKL
ncbi:MAG: hypothetical protein JSV20_04090 [Candidatus Bathyarchaeota archaeon]|nr:MAG: hypothetical protein JSV20_04090 [Candidatus Bathyarchaeota archaeon]